MYPAIPATSTFPNPVRDKHGSSRLHGQPTPDAGASTTSTCRVLASIVSSTLSGPRQSATSMKSVRRSGPPSIVAKHDRSRSIRSSTSPPFADARAVVDHGARRRQIQPSASRQMPSGPTRFGPRPAVREAAVGGDVERGESPPTVSEGTRTPIPRAPAAGLAIAACAVVPSTCAWTHTRRSGRTRAAGAEWLGAEPDLLPELLPDVVGTGALSWSSSRFDANACDPGACPQAGGRGQSHVRRRRFMEQPAAAKQILGAEYRHPACAAAWRPAVVEAAAWTPIGQPHGGWQAPLLDQESDGAMFAKAKSMDALLPGRKTYEIFASYWPRAPRRCRSPACSTGFPSTWPAAP